MANIFSQKFTPEQIFSNLNSVHKNKVQIKKSCLFVFVIEWKTKVIYFIGFTQGTQNVGLF